MIQSELVHKLDDFFNVRAYNESALWLEILTPGEQTIYQREAPEFVEGGWNGLLLDSTPEVDRVYLIVFPHQAVLDTILAALAEGGG